MKKVILSLSCFATFTSVFAQDCSKIFISEYVEGRGNNKAIEIYNPTNQPVNLGEYFLQRYSNGSTTASAQGSPEAKTVQLVGTLAPYSAMVYVIDLRNPAGTGQTAPVWDELQAKADHFLCPTYATNNVMYFNGNDALLLAKGNAASPFAGVTNPTAALAMLCDVFGKIGEDPETVSGGAFNGWTSVSPFNGTSGNPNDKVVTEDHSMIRKAAVKKGHTPWPIPNVTFNPLLEWDSIPPVIPRLDQNGNPIYNAQGNLVVDGNWSTLGWHACECDPNHVGVDEMNLDEIKLYPNPTTGAFTITGLDKVATIEVYNSLGQEIVTINNNTQSTVSFDLAGKAGIYMVTITNKNGRSATQKVIVK